jgi:ferredoxin-nitrite reductase
LDPTSNQPSGTGEPDRYGMTFHGGESTPRFVRPYRSVGRLNAVEQLKLERHPFEVAAAVVERYAVEGPEALHAVPGEVERLKWVGLYPQRQGGDAFMMRIKVPGGVLSAAQAREVGRAAEAFARGPAGGGGTGEHVVDLTTRQSMQVHGIRIGEVPRLWAAFRAVGLTTVQACGDCARNVTCCPVSGVDAAEVVEALPVAQAISAFFTANRDYANLPRKFKIGVVGCVEDCARVEIDDVGLWPARLPDGTVGFNVLVGGGLSDGERMASDVDVFVRPEQATELCRGVAAVFAELGNREHRGLARLRYLVQELGPEGFRHELVNRLGFEPSPAGEDLTLRHRGDHVGVHPERRAGRVYVGCAVPVGRLRGLDLVEAARLAEDYGDGSVRLGPDQNLILSGVAQARLDDLLAEPFLARYSPFPGPFTRGVACCTGSEFCRFAVVETKQRAARWARDLDQRLARIDRADSSSAGGADHGARSGPGARVASEAFRVHFSGCSASCAQPQIADVGLRGAVAHVEEQLVEAADVGLGGSLGPEAGFLRWVAGAVPLDELPDLLVSVYSIYRRERRSDEVFHRWARRQPLERLRAVLGTGRADSGRGTAPAGAVTNGGRS